MGSDETICDTAIVLEHGEYYSCFFTLNSEAVIWIELEVKNPGPKVDLITMDDINYQDWKDGGAYYYKESTDRYAPAVGANLGKGGWD